MTPDDKAAFARGRKTWLYRGVAWGIIPFSLYALYYSTTHMVRWVDAGFELTQDYRIPPDDKAFSDTIVGELSRALAGGDTDGMVEQAIKDGELRRGDLIVKWAAEVHNPVKPETIAHLARAKQWDQQALRATQDAFWGGVTGQPDSLWGFAGAIAVDLTPAGDLRDVTVQGGKWLIGGEPDYLILGLATIGLSLTVLDHYGWGIPDENEAQFGKAVLKDGMRFQRVSRPLRREIEGIVESAVDVEAAKEVGRMDSKAASRIIKRDGLVKVLGTAQTVGGIYKTAGEGVEGARAVVAGLTYADNVTELGIFARMVKNFGINAAPIMEISAGNIKRVFRVMKATTRIAERTQASYIAAKAALYALVWSIIDMLGRMIGKKMLLGRFAIYLGRRKAPASA